MVHAGGQRRSAGWVVLMALLVGCGGGGSNDGTFVERTTVAVRGVVDDGTPTSPVANARCRALDLDGRTLHTVTADAGGAFILLVNPGVRGFIACAPPGQPTLELRAFFSTVGQPEGGELTGQTVLPATTVIGRLVAQEFIDGLSSNPVARRDALLGQVETDAALGLLTEVATLLFNAVRGGADADFEALLLDLVDDSVLDDPAFADRAEDIDAAVATLETEAGLSLADAYLARFPDFRLSLLHHAGAGSALLDAGPGRSDFGGVARFASVVANTRLASRSFGSSMLVAAGDQIAPGPILQTSQDRRPTRFFDAEALNRIGYDAFGLGASDLALGPVVLSDFLAAFDTPVPMVISTIDPSGEQNLLGPILNTRLRAVDLREIGARRVGIVSAVRPDLARVSSPRRLGVAGADGLVEALQAQVDEVRRRGARVVVLLSQQADLAAEQALVEQIEGVDVVVAGRHLLAGPEALLVPGDAEQVVGDYPRWVTAADGAEVPLVSTAGAFRYLGRLDVRFDALGRLLDHDGQNSGPIRVAAASLADGVMPDDDIDSAVLVPLREALDALAAARAADVDVPLDARAASLRSVETNFGNLLADAVFALARSQAQGFAAANATAGVVAAGTVTVDAVIPTGRLERAELFDLLPNDELLTVVGGVTPTQLKRLLEFALAAPGGPEFLQLAGLRLEWDPNGTAQVLAADGTVVTEGSRVRELRLAGGARIVENGALRDNAPNVNLATTRSVARGVFGHPAIGGNVTNVGITLPQALNRYLIEALGQRVRQGEYPESGDDRITRLGG